MAISVLNNAKRNKADEFYTQLSDIEKELMHYKEYFKNKVVFCNCDDPYESNFFKYFAMNFNYLKLKKLISVCYYNSPIVNTEIKDWGVNTSKIKALKEGRGFVVTISEVNDYNHDGAVNLADVEWLLQNKKNTIQCLKGDGDFRSEESIELLKQADIVVTNPPFSLFGPYLAQLVEYEKKFIIIGNINAVTFKDVFPLIKNNKIWIGISIHSGDREFRVPDSYPLEASGCRIDENGVKYIRVKGVRWFTNIEYQKRYEELTLYKKYDKNYNFKYEDYDAINCDDTPDIPCDYYGVIGVPITFIDKYCPRQFEILECHEPCIDIELLKKLPQFKEYKSRQKIVNNKLCQKKYHRLFIKRKTKYAN